MRVAVVHNLPAGGARRRLEEQVRGSRHDVVEICPETALPVTDDPIVVTLRPRAERHAKALRPPLRYADHVAISAAWREVAHAVDRVGADVVYANPCRFLQAPLALRWVQRPSLYFCDEPRRVDHEPAASASRSRATAGVYGPLYALQRAADRGATESASRLCTNSRHTASRILRAYGRDAAVVPMGIPAGFTADGAPAGDGILSVGALIPSKGHDLVIRAVGEARVRRPVTVVAPRAGEGEQARLAGVAAAVGVRLDVHVGISDEDLRLRMRRAHAVMYLAREEPFGLVALEAQACGTPVVVSDEGGLPETLVDGRTGFAVARDPKAAAAALDLLDDPACRAALSAQAAGFAAQHTWLRSSAFVDTALDELGQVR